jgi:hypothetical protein
LAIIQNLADAPAIRAALVEQAIANIQIDPNGEAGEDKGTAVAQLDGMRLLGLPLGWKACTLPGFLTPASAVDCAQSAEERNTVRWWFSKMGGFAITVAAASLGAPFWFDLLNRIVNIRLSGQKPPSSRSEE